MHGMRRLGIVVAALLAACGGDEEETRVTNEANAPPGAPPAVASPPASGGEAPAPSAPPATSSKGRLLVGDGDPQNPRMIVVDLDEGKVAATYPTLGTVSAYRSHAGSHFAFANQRVAGIVEIVASGVSYDEATKSVVKGAPSILASRFEGPMPTHWVHHDRWVVSFNDGDGSFDYLLEPTLGETRVLTRRATTGRKHHGVAVVSHGNVFATLPDPANLEASLPVGVTMRRLATPDAVVKQSDACPGLHGEGGSEEIVAFGCLDGVLLAERKDGDFEFRKLANPEGTPAGRRVGTIRMDDASKHLVGNWGNGIVVIDPAASPPSWTPVDFGAANLAFYVSGDHVVALDGNGALRRFDAKTGAAIGAPLPVIDAWNPAAGTSPPKPALGLGAAKAFVTDPRTGVVVEIDLASWTKERTLTVGGQPSSVAAFGRIRPPSPSTDAGEAGLCRSDGPCTSDDECCEYCHDMDHCH